MNSTWICKGAKELMVKVLKGREWSGAGCPAHSKDLSKVLCLHSSHVLHSKNHRAFHSTMAVQNGEKLENGAGSHQRRMWTGELKLRNQEFQGDPSKSRWNLIWISLKYFRWVIFTITRTHGHLNLWVIFLPSLKTHFYVNISINDHNHIMIEQRATASKWEQV